VRALKPGRVAPQLLRTGAGFHVLKLVTRQELAAGQITQTRARHILLRTSPQLSAELAARRLADYKRQIETGAMSFEDMAQGSTAKTARPRQAVTSAGLRPVSWCPSSSRP
jgi:peptidyl-prolyl cis-trans isomerase SurA